jgi:hypothetical protein
MYVNTEGAQDLFMEEEFVVYTTASNSAIFTSHGPKSTFRERKCQNHVVGYMPRERERERDRERRVIFLFVGYVKIP